MIKIGIIGLGFTGLGAAYYLKDLKNCKITIIESKKQAGGLSKGFKMPDWEWYIDDLIHHWFANDKEIFQLIKNLGLENKLILKDTKSSYYYQGKIAELDSIISLLKFPFLNFRDRIRMGVVMAWLKFNKNYLSYEEGTACDFLKKTMGEKAFEMAWEPLFIGKFGKYAEKINIAWFWSRLCARTKKLAYFWGGFQSLIDNLVEFLKKSGVKIVLNSPVKTIEKKGKKIIIKIKNKKYDFDIVIVTIPLPVFLKVTAGLPLDYVKKLKNLKIICSQYLIFELEKPFLEEGSYWLNINDKEFPFMMVAEHTNFVSKKHYNNKHIIWVGKYLDKKDGLWKLNKKQLLDKIIPYLKKINSNFDESWIKRSFLKRYEYSQPIIEKNYSRKKPKIKTPIENLYIANMHHISPKDRGTNNAFILGGKVARLIKEEIFKKNKKCLKNF